jgi:annexin A7/11
MTETLESPPSSASEMNFNDGSAEESAKRFYKATKRIGTDEQMIINEIIRHTNAQRQAIKRKYQVLYGHTLEEDLKSDLSGNFKKVVLALLNPRFIFEAKCMRNAIHVIIFKICSLCVIFSTLIQTFCEPPTEYKYV